MKSNSSEILSLFVRDWLEVLNEVFNAREVTVGVGGPILDFTVKPE